MSEKNRLSSTDNIFLSGTNDNYENSCPGTDNIFVSPESNTRTELRSYSLGSDSDSRTRLSFEYVTLGSLKNIEILSENKNKKTSIVK